MANDLFGSSGYDRSFKHNTNEHKNEGLGDDEVDKSHLEDEDDAPEFAPDAMKQDEGDTNEYPEFDKKLDEAMA